MTVSSELRKVIRPGDGSNKTFTYPFFIPTDDDYRLVYTDADGVESDITTNFNIDGVGDEDGGSVTYPVTGDAIASGTSITIIRDMPYTQKVSIKNQRRYSPSENEKGLDYAIMMIQQVKEEVDRAVKISISSTGSAEDYLQILNTVKIDILDAQAAAETAQSGAETAETAAETAQSAAETAQSGAEAAQTAAETAQSGAETAQTAAETAQSGAETAQTAAETAQSVAETAQAAAEGEASDAANSASAAASSAADAASSETAAEAAQSGAETAQAAAEAAQSAAETAQSGAETAQSGASNSKDKAYKWAEEDEDVEVEAGEYSAKHWATKAEEFSTGAAVNISQNNANGLGENQQEVNDTLGATKYDSDDIATQAEAEAGTGDGLMTAELTKQAIDANVSETDNLLLIQDQQADGGGRAGSSGVNVRVLNTVVINNILGSSLSSNRVTLPAGTYYVEADPYAQYCDTHQAALWNYTDNEVVIAGVTAYSVNGNNNVNSTNSDIVGVFTIPSEKEFEIRHDIARSYGSAFGIGGPQFAINKVNMNLKIWKVA